MAAAEDKEKDEEGGKEAEAAPPKKGKGKLIIIIAAVVVIVGGVLGFVLLGGKEPPQEGEVAEAAEKEQTLSRVEMKTFIVNLSTSTSFLKTTIVLEYDAALMEGGEGGGGGGGGHGESEGGGLPGVLGEKEALIRDSVIRVLSSKTAETVLSVEGKEQIKEEVIEAINDAVGLDEPAVTNVYFQEYIVQ